MTVPLLIAGLAALLAWGLHSLLARFEIHVPWWFDMPSLVGFYGLLLAWFDRRLWRAARLRRLGLVRTPYLGGTWSGTVSTSHDDFASSRTAALTIHQTWQRLSIELKTDTSDSRSHSASMTTIPPRNVVVIYSYTNEPVSDAPETMHSFRGTATQTFVPGLDGDTFSGDYYTGRDRGTFGTLTFSRQRNEPLGPASNEPVGRHEPEDF